VVAGESQQIGINPARIVSVSPGEGIRIDVGPGCGGLPAVPCRGYHGEFGPFFLHETLLEDFRFIVR